ncbi:MAG TPA: hypothetical protein VKT76_03905 [Bradyrhizobium sp.]|nr:hypothetical protein [Bradyrhizobium sp.]
MVGRTLFWNPWGLHGDFSDDKGDGRGYSSQTLTTPLLGRFDRIIIEEAKHTARYGRPRGAPWETVSFFRRQQIGLPFACKRADISSKNESKVARLEAFESSPYPSLVRVDAQQEGLNSCVPLATINLLLIQRSARLTFVESLLTEDIVMRSYCDGLRSPYAYFDPEKDVGLLTDGWGDIFLVLFSDIPEVKMQPSTGKTTFEIYANESKKILNRLSEVIQLRRYLFRDPLVVRSETSYTPAAFDAALLHPENFQTTMSIRFKSSWNEMSAPDRFEEHVLELFKEYNLTDMFSLSRVSGRTDYSVSTKARNFGRAQEAYARFWCDSQEKNPYGVIYERLRREFFKGIADHIDSTSTSISEILPFGGREFTAQ